MSELLEKSKQSFESAKILLKNNYYPSSVSRSYYACFQYILYTLFEKLKKDKEEYYKEVREKPTGTHGWASKLISIDLAKKCSHKDYKWFQENLPLLKKKRIEADYYSDIIKPEDGHDSINKAESLINMLKTNFK